MNISNTVAAKLLGFLLLTMTCTASAEYVVYACHVVTESGQPTIVSIETGDGPAFAEKTALQLSARLPEGSESTVTEVVECINMEKQKFHDKEMQKLLESMPR